MDAPAALSSALAEVLAGLPTKQLSAAVAQLIESYRGVTPTDAPVLGDRLHVAAYAAYRMPATYAAMHTALAELARLTPGWHPETQLDIGGGTGAAVWAATEVWPSLRSAAVLDWSTSALALGRELAPPLECDWRQTGLDDDVALPIADVVTMSYVLGELTVPAREALVARLIAHGRPLVVVEPGTPAGYRRVLAARDQMIAAGMRIVAPCPHSAQCPLAPTNDWCHFSVRVNRSSLHRQVKEAALSYEDEKFSYAVGTFDDVSPAEARVIRHPQYRKGLVQLELCTRSHGVRSEPVSKKQGARYRAARDLDWGDPWTDAGGSTDTP